jgi:hypothetical protein
VIDRARATLQHLLTALNWLGSILLAYALANPGAMSEFLGYMPASAKPYAPLLAIAWFALIQFAKAQAIAKAK